jgi:predicted RNA-binding Zn ribbon-like protein
MTTLGNLWNDALKDAPWASKVAPAPGELCLVQALVNTVDLRRGSDELTTPRALADWLERWGFPIDDGEIGQTELERTRAVRGGLGALIGGNAREEVDPAAVERLNRSASSPMLRVRYAPGAEPRLEVAVDGFEAVMGHLGRIVVGASEAGVWSRLKVCAGENCGLTFYDTSPNAKRKWCSMRRCGNRVKARTFRRRHDTRLFKPAVRRRGRRSRG